MQILYDTDIHFFRTCMMDDYMKEGHCSRSREINHLNPNDKCGISPSHTDKTKVIQCHILYKQSPLHDACTEGNILCINLFMEFSTTYAVSWDRNAI